MLRCVVYNSAGNSQIDWSAVENIVSHIVVIYSGAQYTAVSEKYRRIIDDNITHCGLVKHRGVSFDGH